MTLKVQIQEDIKNAMREKAQTKLNALRLLSAAIKQKEVDSRKELGDTEVLEVIEKAIKQRKDSIAQYTKAGRNELAAAEQFEIDTFTVYKPAAMSAAEVEAIIVSAISEIGAKAMNEMGKVMAAVKPVLAGKADMSEVSAIIKQKLSA